MNDMFQEELFKITGSYLPQFMYIKIHSPEHNILFHEYIHHLQNVTTFYSINSFLTRKLKYFEQILKIKKMDGTLLMQDLQDILSEEYSLLFKTYGDKFNLGFTNVEINNIKCIFNESGNAITNLELHLLIDNIYQVKKYNLGTLAIMECMANLIEQEYYPNRNSNPDLVYHICYMVICYYCPKLQNNIIVVVAILELSLMFTSPVDFIIKLLLLLKNKNKNDLTVNNIYDIVFNDKSVNYYENGNKELFRRIDNRLDIAYTLFIDSEGDTFDVFKNWQKKVLIESYSIRKENPLLLTSMLETNVFTNHNHPLASHIIKLPPIISGNYEHMQLNDEIVRYNLLLFLAEEEVIKRFSPNYKESCILKEFCKEFIKYGGKGIGKYPSFNYGKAPYEYVKTLETIYNEDSCKNPTTRKLNEKICPFTIIWQKIINYNIL